MNVNKTKVNRTEWTGYHLLGFTDPVSEGYVRRLSKTIIEARPLDKGVAMDWTWHIKLSHEDDINHIEQCAKFDYIEREMGQNLQFQMD